jgi:polysaccharide biosynthesis protein PslH
MSEMKILLLTNKPPWPPNDGGALATLNMIKGLSYNGAHVTVLYMNTFKHNTSIEDIPEDLLKIAQFYKVDIKTEIHISAIFINFLFSAKPYNLKRFESDLFSKSLTELLRTGFDIVQCEGLAFYPYYDLIRTHAKAKIVFRPHNVENKIWKELTKYEKNPVKKIYYRIISRRLKHIENDYINKPDALVAISAKDLSWFKGKGLSIPYIIAPCGIDPDLVRSGNISNNMKTGFIGSLDWMPNLQGLSWFLKNVWPVISEKFENATMHIAGRNCNEKSIKSFTGKNIFFHGEVPDSEEFIKDNDVIVAPLFSGSGMRIKIIEAMSLGKVVIATSISAEGIEFSSENILIADTVTEFVDRLTDVIVDDSLKRCLGKNGIATVRSKYNIFTISKEILNFYSTLIT